jgi:hypothetical protein
MVAEITQKSTMRLIHVRKKNDILEVVPPGDGWKNTPLAEEDKKHSYYEGAFAGCDNDGRRPLGDLPGALERPGSFYKIINGGEGIVIISPRAKLAGYFNFG